MMWVVAVGLALVVEAIFIMHNIDPSYYGVSLEFYEVLRIAAVVAAACGILALVLSLRKKEKKKPVWLLGVMTAVSLVPTVHWVVRNDHFRASSLLQRGDVRVHELVAYLKDYPETEPRQVAKWLFNQKSGSPRGGKAGGRGGYPAFVAHQLAYFVMGLPDDLSRYREPIIEAAHKRLQRFKEEQRLAAYREMVRKAWAVPNAHNERRMRVLAEGGGRIVAMRLDGVTPEKMGSWKPGTRGLVGILKQKSEISFPLRAKLELKDEVDSGSGGKHDELWKAALRCGLLDTMAAHGLLIEPAGQEEPVPGEKSGGAPAFRIVVRRTGEVVKGKFKLEDKVFNEMPVPIYTLDVAVHGGGSAEPIYSRRATTSKAIFGFSVTSEKTRGGLQRELRRRAMRYACSPIAGDFRNRHLFPPTETNPRAGKKTAAKKSR